MKVINTSKMNSSEVINELWNDAREYKSGDISIDFNEREIDYADRLLDKSKDVRYDEASIYARDKTSKIVIARARSDFKIIPY